MWVTSRQKRWVLSKLNCFVPLKVEREGIKGVLSAYTDLRQKNHIKTQQSQILSGHKTINHIPHEEHLEHHFYTF